MPAELRASAGYVATGLALLVSAPGGPWPWIAPVAWIPCFVAMGHTGRTHRLAGIGLIAMAYAGPLAAGLFERDPWIGVAFGSASASILVLACLAGAVGAAAGWLRMARFAVAWTVLAYVLDGVGAHVRPWPLCAGLALEVPVLQPLVALGGWPLLEAALFLSCASIWGAVTQRSRWRGPGLLAGVLLTIVVVALSAGDGLRVVGTIQVGAVQPNLEWPQLRAVGTSALARVQVRERYERLSRQAVHHGAQLIVWPENGLALPLGQVRSLRSWVLGLVPEHNVALLAAGEQRTSEGIRPAAFAVGDGAVQAIAKQEQVPGLEAPPRGESTLVWLSPFGPVGVLTCYDAVRSRTVRGAVDAGAEVLLAPTDNGSYIGSTLTAWQRTTAGLLAMEVGRPLVFVASRGPSITLSPQTRIRSVLRRGQRGSVVTRVDRVQGRTIAAEGGRWWCFLLSVAVGVGLWVRSDATQPSDTPGTLPTRRRLGARDLLLVASCSSVGLGVGAATSVLLAGPPYSTGSAPPVPPSHATFRQSAPEGCGPAALAWLLFVLGDLVYEEDLAAHEQAHTLAELAEAARGRGFQARPVVGSPSGLRSATDVGYILHVADSHFVACLPRGDGSFTVFDPATARLMQLDADELRAQWSTHGLEVKLISAG